MSVLTTKEIMDIIPHRHPFLLVDTIEELVPGVRAAGKKCVTYDEYYFRGHFPQEPVMPGVLIIEALAQVGAVCILSCEKFKGKTAYFGGINNCRFKKKVVPGDVLMLETEGTGCDCKSNSYGRRKSGSNGRTYGSHWIGEQTCFGKY